MRTVFEDPVVLRAREAVRKVLADHNRRPSPFGVGYMCQCGDQFPDQDAWHRHRADLAASAALEVLAPHA